MNIIVVDAARLAGEADFPMLDVPKYGWQQYPVLEGAEVAERCWRADVIVTVGTPIDRAVMDKAFKLALIVVAGADYGHVDLAAARERGISVCHLPGVDPADAGQTAEICRGVIDIIAAYLDGTPLNRIGG